MANKYGLFGDTGYLAVGDPYIDKDPLNHRTQGLNFKSTKCKTGTTNDAMFDRVKPLYEGEPYTKSNEDKAKAREAESKSKASDHPFRPSGKFKNRVGQGAVHMPEQDLNKLIKQKGDFEVEPRNIVTNPSKRGTFGFNKTTLGERQGFGGAVGEYTYVPCPYDSVRTAERAKRAKDAEKAQDKPFRPSNPPKRGSYGIPGTTLGGKGTGVSGEYSYVESGPLPKGEAEPPLEKPFRPTGPAKQGYNRTINKFPVYQEDPLEVKLKEERETKAAAREKMASAAGWFPPKTLKGGATPSVLKKNIHLNFAATYKP
mmetsp:Transcript_9502/g.19676  ORF Transcript_9502/g.19676 Transcript_9502/m.19676 type:complete len:314 (-) Transcript_9502:90-1031(-)|eukprot:CAMPEP_0118922736 /NCGR_PEP_ID=MMETSP1169-20130426/1561_1 /TAXON_ID=36882 /ORGANISM="Pyramimonas obovata, Strain CCMP722" /LENGTH=313 /DNA_ID=CAMNT_0006863655 /DNA_START=147 /DNA_END=1091 /DNA_ORIENTATION=+